MKTIGNRWTRREFLGRTAIGLGAAGVGLGGTGATIAQVAGERPARVIGVEVLNPLCRVPIGWIIDDSTCLVNLNRFAVPQFAQAWGPGSSYTHPWRDWPHEIPDAFVRKFGEWCGENGVKGKYSIVPYPACVGRLDRGLPGWTQKELRESLALVREVMMPNWDIHPEMVTHTRVIDLKTGHPYEDHSLKFMENWEWTTGRSAGEIAEYMAYALQILKNVGLPCEGVTTPGGFGNRALPQLAQAAMQSVRSVFGAEIPHYFRHLYAEGPESVAPRVEYVSGLETDDPRCVVSIIGCTGDWTGGWDNSSPAGADKFITADLKAGRLVEVIERGEPAMLLSHWTGVYWNGQELGFRVFQEVHRRLRERQDPLIWMKLSEVARYWAARELTRFERVRDGWLVRAPYACPRFTVSLERRAGATGSLRFGGVELTPVNSRGALRSGTYVAEGGRWVVAVDLPKGVSRVAIT